MPMARLLPLTVSVVVEVAPEGDSVAVPRGTPAREKVTAPPGAVLPLAAFTVAVS